jgi:hypothetical protein
VTPTSVSRIDKDQHHESLEKMKTIIDKGDGNLVASISEDYVNKLLVTTYDAGLWKKTLDEAEVELGSQKVFVRLSEQGDVANLYLDVKYKFKKFEGFLIGKKGIRFPLVLKVAIRIEKRNGIPVMVIRLKGSDLTDKTLLAGLPDMGLESTIRDVPIFKKQIVQKIRQKIEKMHHTDVIDLRYPELKGLGLETVHFMSDGNGRMNAIMKLEDVVKENISQ